MENQTLIAIIAMLVLAIILLSLLVYMATYISKLSNIIKRANHQFIKATSWYTQLNDALTQGINENKVVYEDNLVASTKIDAETKELNKYRTEVADIMAAFKLKQSNYDQQVKSLSDMIDRMINTEAALTANVKSYKQTLLDNENEHIAKIDAMYLEFETKVAEVEKSLKTKASKVGKKIKVVTPKINKLDIN